MGIVDKTVGRLDDVQRRHGMVGFPLAVVTRYGEDHGGWLGAIISYYGFFALLPLLLVFVTVLSIVFQDDPQQLDRILTAVWDRRPFVVDDIREAVTPIAGTHSSWPWPCWSHCGARRARRAALAASLTGRDLGDADRRAIELTAQRSLLVSRQRIDGIEPEIEERRGR